MQFYNNKLNKYQIAVTLEEVIKEEENEANDETLEIRKKEEMKAAATFTVILDI